MARRVSSRVLGKWRLFESDLWDTDFLDLVEPAYIRFDANGLGEFKFGCVSAGIDCSYGRDSASFTWAGFDEMDETNGDGDAELDDNGILTIELSFHLGDDAVLKARRWSVRSTRAGRTPVAPRSRVDNRGRRRRLRGAPPRS